MQTGTFLALRRFYKILRMPKKAEKNSGKNSATIIKCPSLIRKEPGRSRAAYIALRKYKSAKCESSAKLRKWKRYKNADCFSLFAKESIEKKNILKVTYLLARLRFLAEMKRIEKI